MPIIVFASPKGGAGKTTSSFILACELASRGLSTHVIDADPNHPIAGWANRGGEFQNLSVRKSEGEETVLEDIDEAADQYDFVIVDLEGTANLSVAYAISRADFVVVPSQRSALDAGEAAKAVALVKRQSSVTNRDIPVAILLTRTSPAIRSRGLKRMLNSLDQHKIDSFITEIHEREAYKAVFDHAKTLHQLSFSKVSGLAKAKTNAADFTAELLRKLKDHKDKKGIAA